jgi:formylmethanofuran dehydrogenase subunit B
MVEHRRMTPPLSVENATCLGCGCACDDIGVAVRDGQIVEARNACALGVQWFGNGSVPTRCMVDGTEVSVADATRSVARLLIEADRPLVYLAPGLSCESQREAVAIADLLHARLDSATSASGSPFVLAGQERGLATATLGDVKNRADTVVFWGVDLEGRYPRFASRYAPDPIGMHAPQGRRSRTVIAVDVGDARVTTRDADRRIQIGVDDELATLTMLQALVRTLAGADTKPPASSAVGPEILELASTLTTSRYVALVYDAEHDDRVARSSQRFDAFASLAHALNERTRAAAIPLRAGGNRSGADAVLVAQTGYPFAIDFARGFPRYDPHDGAAVALLRRHEVDLALIVGDVAFVPKTLIDALNTVRCVGIGPHASGHALGHTAVAIDTGRDGIHSGGMAFRSDDVPLPLRPLLTGPLETARVLRDVATAVRQTQFSALAVSTPAVART